MDTLLEVKGPTVLPYCQTLSENLYAEVPTDLKKLPNWVTWKYETRAGKETKPPYNAETNFYAKSDDSSTWTTFEKALAALQGFDGIGLMLGGTRLVGIDFDGVVRDGEPEPFVLEILKQLGNPYSEITPSGQGLRAFVYASLPTDGGRKFTRNKPEKYGAEIYSGEEGGRYLTVTGQHYSGENVCRVEDISLPYLMISQIQNETFKSLWMGDLAKYDGDQSRADLALLGKLAHLLDGDAEKMDACFTESILGQRYKWIEREDYRKLTIKKALSSYRPTLDKTRDSEPPPKSSARGIILERADQTKPRRIMWLWPNRIPQGKLIVFAGNPGVTKSVATCEVAAITASKRDWPDCKKTNEPREVLMMVGEDGWEDTVVPRLMAAGADLSRVHHLKIVSCEESDGMTRGEREFRFDTDIKLLEKTLDDNPNIRLVIVDPASNYLGKAKMFDEQAVRAMVLVPLADLAERKKVSVIVVMHLNKKADLEAIHRVGGAMAFVGVARSAWLFVRDPKDKELIYMLQLKSNNAKLDGGLKYRIVDAPVQIEGHLTEMPRVEWLGPADRTADEGLGEPVRKRGRTPNKLETAKEWLPQYLSNGKQPLHSNEKVTPPVLGILEAAKDELDISRQTLYRAMKELGIRSVIVHGIAYWELNSVEENEPLNSESDEWKAAPVSLISNMKNGWISEISEIGRPTV
jgi:AAA domain